MRHLRGRAMIKSFEGARGFAALMVALFHLQIAAWFPLVGYGYLFVDLFFVLSGYLITSIYLHRIVSPTQFVKFILRRFGRLFPLLIFSSILFVLAVDVVTFAKNEAVARGLFRFSSGVSAVPFLVPTAGELLATVTMTHGVGFFNRPILNWASWSISAEFYTYLLFAMLCLTLPKRLRLAAFTLLALAGYAVTSWATLAHHSCLTTQYCFDVTYDFGLARCISAFFLGGVTWYAGQRFAALDVRRRGWLQWGTCVALAAIFTLARQMPLLAFVCPPVFAVFVLSLAGDVGSVAHVLKRPVFQLLGERSYSIYMMHPVLLQFLMPLQRKFTGPAASACMLIAYTLLTVWVAGYTYRLIEVPCRDFFNRIAGRVPEPRLSRPALEGQ
jgi:peptidoglycan/LPS O-acetylase OafA/YrhL